jgi:hypothetical protein
MQNTRRERDDILARLKALGWACAEAIAETTRARRAFARQIQPIPGVARHAAISWKSVTKLERASTNSEEQDSSWREAAMRSVWSFSLFS